MASKQGIALRNTTIVPLSILEEGQTLEAVARHLPVEEVRLGPFDLDNWLVRNLQPKEVILPMSGQECISFLQPLNQILFFAEVIMLVELL